MTSYFDRKQYYTHTHCVLHTQNIYVVYYTQWAYTLKNAFLCYLQLNFCFLNFFFFLFWTGNKCTSDSDVHSPDFESRTQRRTEKSIKWIHTDEWNHNRPLLYNHYIMIIREALIIFKAQVTYALRPTVDEHN